MHVALIKKIPLTKGRNVSDFVLKKLLPRSEPGLATGFLDLQELNANRYATRIFGTLTKKISCQKARNLDTLLIKQNMVHSYKEKNDSARLHKNEYKLILFLWLIFFFHFTA